MCYRDVVYGEAGWKLPPARSNMRECMDGSNFKEGIGAQMGDNFMWFARLLLEGKVYSELDGLVACLNDKPSSITSRKQLSKIVLLVSTLESDDIDTKEKIAKKILANDKYLWDKVKNWCLKEKRAQFKSIWGDMVKAIFRREK